MSKFNFTTEDIKMAQNVRNTVAIAETGKYYEPFEYHHFLPASDFIPHSPSTRVDSN